MTGHWHAKGQTSTSHGCRPTECAAGVGLHVDTTAHVSSYDRLLLAMFDGYSTGVSVTVHNILS